MSVGFRAVQWNRTKLVYDGILLAAVALYIGGFIVVDASSGAHPQRCASALAGERPPARGRH